MVNPTYPITGIQSGLGPKPNQVPLRIEVDDFYNDPKLGVQRDLLYQALTKFQAMKYDDKLSFFQVGGIHGLPYITWDDPNKPFGTYHPMYCEHGTVLFGTWHRPYMALFEQRLYEIMVNEIIPTYPQYSQAAFKKEADLFRLPYWDWATKKPRTQDGKNVVVFDLPLIVKNQYVEISTPTGQVTTIRNPFYNFEANDKMGNHGVTSLLIDESDNKPALIPFDQTRATSRCPPDSNQSPKNLEAFVSAKGVADNATAAENIAKANWHKDATFTLQEAVHRILSPGYFDTYTEFVTAAETNSLESDPKSWLSLEFIHGNLHVWTGGRFGHMGHVPVAGFDPIFFLHHCNVDRLLALWQAINPDKWFEKFEDNNDPKHPRTLTPTTPLAPFHSDNKATIYTSETARNHIRFGYTYPELQRWNFKSDKEFQAHVKSEIERLYGPSAETGLRLTHLDVNINVSFEKFALNGLPFTVSIFLEGQLVGKVENFSFVPINPEDGSTACENCREQSEARLRVTGQVLTTNALVQIAQDPTKELKVFDRKSIAAYLKKNLSWNVKLFSGREVEVPSLKVFPIIGRRNAMRLPDPEDDSDEAQAPIKLPNGATDLPSINPEVILGTDAHWVVPGQTLTVKDNDDASKEYRLEIGGWDAYVPLY